MTRRTPRGIAYEVVGDGPVLLAVHGGPGTDHSMFRPYLDPLAAELAVVYFDLPGHGRSAESQDYGLVAMAASIEDILAAVGAERVFLLGSSYGGFLSLTYALEHPERVAGLILVDTSASYGFRAESLEVARQRATPSMLAALERLWDDSLADDEDFHAAWREILPLYFHRLEPAEVERLADRGAYRLETRRQILPTLREYDLNGRLAEIEAPTLVIVGRHDWITAVGQAEALAAGLPQSRLAVFEHSGHYPFVEEHERFVAIVQEWMANAAEGE